MEYFNSVEDETRIDRQPKAFHNPLVSSELSACLRCSFHAHVFYSRSPVNYNLLAVNLDIKTEWEIFAGWMVSRATPSGACGVI